MKLDYGYLFKITSYLELMNYWLDVRQNRLREGFGNYLNSREFISLAGPTCGERHLSHGDAAFLHQACQSETAKDNPRGVVEIFCEITDALFRGMNKTVQEKGHIYINKNGGYFHLVPGMEETETKEVEQFIIPGQKIEIKQWPNGEHYYAYVGGVSVEMDGTNKWSTKGMARIKAEQWAKQNDVSFEEE
jgi:hypothetical protein